MVLNDAKIEADWRSFHSMIKVPADFSIDERTQCSLDVFKEITQINLKARSGKMVTGGTKLHVQKDTNLCAYFATMSVLRHQLRKLVGSEKSGKDNSEENLHQPKKYMGLQIEEFMSRKDQDEKRFERDLAVMIGCVCPRALSARFKILIK